MEPFHPTVTRQVPLWWVLIFEAIKVTGQSEGGSGLGPDSLAKDPHMLLALRPGEKG